MNILDEIVAFKRTEVAARKKNILAATLEKSEWFEKPVLSLKTALLSPDKTGIIAEHKRKSPSKGIINEQLSVAAVTTGYVAAGASALSVLTDEKYFGGSDEDLRLARQHNPQTPLLRKDFVIDEYQLLEARSLGADVVLLIAACLTPVALKALARFAKNLNLEIILEVHDSQELNTSLNEFIDVVGVNNRNLKLMITNLNTSRELAALIPDNFLKISESGIHQPEVMAELKEQYGYNGFLIGEYFMQQPDPGMAMQAFLKSHSSV